MADVLEAALLVEAGAVTEGRAAGVRCVALLKLRAADAAERRFARSAGFETGRAEGHATGVLNGFELGALPMLDAGDCCAVADRRDRSR